MPKNKTQDNSGVKYFASNSTDVTITLHFSWLRKYVDLGFITKGQYSEISKYYDQQVNEKFSSKKQK